MIGRPLSSWSNSDDQRENPTVSIPAPQNPCTFIEGSISVVVTDSSGQTVTATLPYKNTRGGDAVNPTPTSPIKCHACRGPKFICERSHREAKCGEGDNNPLNLPDDQVYKYQYCINDVENLIDGSRYVLRRCATAAEVNKDWIGDSANRDECRQSVASQWPFAIRPAADHNGSYAALRG